MKISLIAAYANNRVIGDQGQIPWHLSEDLKRFKALTLDHTIVMGRKTFESLNKPLAKRRNVVLTRDSNYQRDGVDLCLSLTQAIDQAKVRGEDKLFVIGGAEIYSQALEFADELILTLVDKDVDGDAYFPDWDASMFEEVAREDHEGYSFVDYQRLK